ncbi:NmrA family NAD(P)-binding protein [Kineococcus aurantiacus]|uniref:NAD(P)H dehydrogenase (Quinone) n=1 Tax=Kineococcus aurantiacus TaxID=37633 RepID=A0A7Y9ARX2_9ACTN|nr:NAD(P)H dehydrogenase (quinone) [Kineococcus aurantiacus]
MIVITAARRPRAAEDLGVEVRYADCDAPASLVPAFAGARAVLLVSGTEPGRRVEQHGAAVEAAARAGVEHLVHTGAPRVDSTALVFAPEHPATERLIAGSGIPFTTLRNNWYLENHAPTIVSAASTGHFVGNAAGGAVASAARDDCAEAAAVVLSGAGHANRVHELAGDSPWTCQQLAGTVSAQLGRPVTYEDIGYEEHRAQLEVHGVPPAGIDAIAGVERNIAEGALELSDVSLRTLLGRATTPLADTVRDVLTRQPVARP